MRTALALNLTGNLAQAAEQAALSPVYAALVLAVLVARGALARLLEAA